MSIDLVAEMAAHIGGDEIAQIVAPVEHRQHDALQSRARVEARAAPARSSASAATALRAHRTRIAAAPARHRAATKALIVSRLERRRAVDQHIVVSRRDRSRSASRQPKFAALARRRVRARRRRARPTPAPPPEPRHRGRHDRRRRASASPSEQLVAGDAARLGAACRARCWHCPADRDRSTQHPVAGGGERGRQIDRGRGLADAALLVGDGDDAGAARDAGARLGLNSSRGSRTTCCKRRTTPRGIGAAR